MASNRPYKQEIVTTVRQFLSDEAHAEVDSKALAYKLRIAANLLAILERELEQSSQAWLREQQRLTQWCDESSDDPYQLNQALCEKIRSGQLDNDTVLFEHLCETVFDKIAIDNPKYSTYLAWQQTRHTR